MGHLAPGAVTASGAIGAGTRDPDDTCSRPRAITGCWNDVRSVRSTWGMESSDWQRAGAAGSRGPMGSGVARDEPPGGALAHRSRRPLAARRGQRMTAEAQGRRAEAELVARDPVLAEIVRRLVAAYQPERIYLFGSVARGEAGPDSDYDLLVIVPDDAAPERKDSRLAYEVLWGAGRAADVIVWRKTPFKRRARVVCSLPATVLWEGRVLYAA